MMHKGLFFIGWLFLLSSVGAQELEIDNALLLGKKELIGGEDYVLLPPVAEHFEAMKLAAAKDSMAIKIVPVLEATRHRKKFGTENIMPSLNKVFHPYKPLTRS